MRKRPRVKVRPAKPADIYAAARRLPRTKWRELRLRASRDVYTRPAGDASTADAKPATLDLSLTIPATIYVQDPLVAEQHPSLGLQDIEIAWEPGLMDGPTSARVAVVDYDGDTDELAAPARWDEQGWRFLDPENRPIGRENPHTLQFHQVNAWAVVQNALAFYEHPMALGRPVPWAFAGNRLIVVPHAGYGENAFYDRQSKSLQFYTCGPEDDRVYTCLSHDIIAHETGHAILDGLRPHYNECSSLQTLAFHEFIADLTAILTLMRNNDVRRVVARVSKKGPEGMELGDIVSDLAEEFGTYVEQRPYIRSARNRLSMQDVQGSRSPHYWSQVLTGATFDLFTAIVARHLKRGASPRNALWWATDRIRRVALQPLDFCPPVDIQFMDYVRAVMRADELSNPADPQGYRVMMDEIFHRRGLCERSLEEHKAGVCDLTASSDEPRLLSFDVERLSMSRTAAYLFLHENREQLCIPVDQDIVVADLYGTDKVTRAWRRLPREIVLAYVWSEDVELMGAEYGPLEGQAISLLCGGTLVFDDRGNLLSWARKPGTQMVKDRAEGLARRRRLLAQVAGWVADDLVDLADEEGALGPEMWAPIVARRTQGGRLCLQATPPLRHWGDEGGAG